MIPNTITDDRKIFSIEISDQLLSLRPQLGDVLNPASLRRTLEGKPASLDLGQRIVEYHLYLNFC